MATPLNTIPSALLLAPWKQGIPFGVESVDDASFSIEQLTEALQLANDEINERLRGADPSTLPAYRLARIVRAEALLFNANLAEFHAQKNAVFVAQADIANLSSVSRGADVPSREEKMGVWQKVADRYREQAYKLLRGFPFAFSRFSLGYDDSAYFPYESQTLGV